MLTKLKEKINSPEFVVLSLSILFTCATSGVIGLGGSFFLHNFWGTFFISFGAQIVLFFIVNTALQKKDETEITKLQNDQLEALSKYVIKLTCSYCSKPNNVPIILNRENRFKCEFCQQTNGVKMQFFSTQITTPLKKITVPIEIEQI